MKSYILSLILIFSNLISCSKSINTDESLGLFSLLGYRQNVTLGGSFFGNYNADVRTVPLSADGKCDRTLSGLGTTSTDNTGAFSIKYPRISQSGGYVCVIATPKADGTSRFFAVDQQKEFPWTGSTAYSILVVPEPTTTSRSQFNVVSTMFNRMATQRLEKLSRGNTDLSKTASYLKSANKQIVSQFGLSKGISRGVLRASSVENATPDLNDIAIDFNNKEDSTTLKFTVMIGGIQSLGDPTKPESYDQVVNVISKYLASGTGSSVDDSGEPLILPGQTQPLSLGGGNSLASQISQKVAVFVQAQSAALGISASAVAAVTQQVQAQVAAVDKPSFGVSAPVVVVEVTPKLTYTLVGTPFYPNQKISIKPDYLNSNAEKYAIVSSTPSLPSFIKINTFSGEIYGTVPDSLSSVSTISLVVSGTAPGGKSTTQEVNLLLLPPNVNFLTSQFTYNAGQSFTLSPDAETTRASSFSLSGTPSLPAFMSIHPTTGVITGTVPDTYSGIATYNITVTGMVPGGKTNTQVLSFVFQGSRLEFSNTSFSLNSNQSFTIEPTYSFISAFQFSSVCINANSCVQASTSSNDGAINIDPNTGTISINPLVNAIGNLTYSLTVAGTSPAGTITRSLTVSITGKPGIVYPNQDVNAMSSSFEVGSNLPLSSILPVISGTYTSIQFLSDPPPGIVMASDGAINVTPMDLATIYSRVVRISNSIGYSDYTINFKPIAPQSLSYPISTRTLRVGETYSVENGTALIPVYSGGLKTCSLSSSCSGAFSASLPTGMFLDPSSCTIYGQPTTVTLSQSYCITLTNPSGTISVPGVISLAVTKTLDSPYFSSTGVYFDRVQTVFSPISLALVSTEAGISYFTSDGSEPSTTSTLFSNPIPIWSVAGEVLRAFSTKTGYEDSSKIQMTGVFSVPPLQTGQITSFTTKDDASQKSGIARMTYTVPETGAYYSPSTGLTWKSTSGGNVNWITAKDSCGTGWRLPSIEELTTLINYERNAAPVIDSEFVSSTGTLFWSQTESFQNNAYAFVVGFGSGRISTQSKTGYAAYRCIKNTASPKRNPGKYTNKLSGSVYDLSTGLVWQSQTTLSKSWDSAISYCNTLSQDGLEWRLPNKNELLSLMDYSKSGNLLIDESSFPNSQITYWSSTHDLLPVSGSNQNLKWIVNFHYTDSNGAVLDGYSKNKTELNSVRCVSGAYSNPDVSYSKREYSIDFNTASPQTTISPISLSGITFNYSQTNFPSGITLNSQTGQISITPINGTYNLVVNATSGNIQHTINTTVNIVSVYSFSGIKSNISVNLLSGWTKCFSESYSLGSTLTSTLKSNCSKNKVLLSCRLASDPSNLILAAYADRGSVFNSTTSSGNSTVISNGVGWYYSDSLSIGFAPAGEAVSRNSCDTNDTSQGSLRICWHTSNSSLSGGWRCGGNTGAGDLYVREIFHAD
jgi:hypothetical protein